MGNIMVGVEISPEQGGYCVVVSINGERISTHGTVQNIDVAEVVQAEQVDIGRKTIQEHVKRLREQLSR
jgi:ribosomal protein L9